MLRIKTIINAVGVTGLSLYRGDGYFYFVYDIGGNSYRDHSVYTMYLNDLPLETWVEEAKDFLVEINVLEAK